MKSDMASTAETPAAIHVLESGHRYIERPSDINLWRAGRKDYVGASEVAAILGVNPYQTAYDVWLSKTGRTTPGYEDNLRMYMGRELEPIIARYYAEQTGRTVVDDPKTWIHPTLPYLRTNLDRIAYPAPEDVSRGLVGDGIVECKTVGIMAKAKWVRGYPEQYFVQVQSELMCTPYEWADLVTLVGGNVDWLVFRIYPDQTMRDLILEEVQRFWQYVETDTEPPLKPVDLSKVLSVPDGSIEATTPVLVDHQTAVRLKREIASLEDQLEAVQDRMKEHIGKNEVLLYRGQPIVTFKTQDGRTTIDAKALKSDKPDIYSQYAQTGAPFRVFRLKEVEVNVPSQSESPDSAAGPAAEPR